MSQKDKSQIKSEVDNKIIDKDYTTGADVGNRLKDIVDSTPSIVEGIKADNITNGTISEDRLPGVNYFFYAEEQSGSNGGDKIQSALDKAKNATGSSIVVVGPSGPDDVSTSTGSLSDGREKEAWKLSTHLSIPSNTALIFRGSYVFLADGTDDNLIRNDDFSNGNENIIITGVGNVVLDGNNANQTDFDDQQTESQKSIGIRTVKADDFFLSNITIRNTTAWAIRPGLSDGFTIRNIVVRQINRTANQDGVHPVGCKNGHISKIRGESGDDMVAINAGGVSGDINEVSGPVSNITVTDVVANTNGHAVVRIYGNGLGDETHEVRDITISNITGHTNNQRIVFISRDPTDYVHLNISISDLTDKSGGAGVEINVPVRGMTITNVNTDGGAAFKTTSADAKVINAEISNLQSRNSSVIRIEDGIVFYTNISNISSFGAHGATVLHQGRMRGTGIYNVIGRDFDTLININGPTNQSEISNITAQTTSTSPGTVLKLNGTVNYDKSVISDIIVREANNVLDAGQGASPTIKDVKQENINGTIWLNTGDVRFRGDNPGFTSPPSNIKGSIVNAGASWDPDGDGDGERVMSDGTQWNEIVPLPNY